MPIIHEANVYLIARQTLAVGLERFLEAEGVHWASDSHKGAEVICETAGRVCYNSFAKPRPGGNAAYLKHILEVGHGSVLEHAVWSLLFTGVSRSLTHELVRHRAGWSYSQSSQRFINESAADFILPTIIANDPRLQQTWLQAIEHSHQAYIELATTLEGMVEGEDKTSRLKKAREAARSVLPNATETRIFVTANCRALRNFIELRASRHAEVEIRKLAIKVLQLMQEEAPNLFGDYQIIELADGTFEAQTEYRKV